jgi:hypothetical protein
MTITKKQCQPPWRFRADDLREFWRLLACAGGLQSMTKISSAQAATGRRRLKRKFK